MRAHRTSSPFISGVVSIDNNRIVLDFQNGRTQPARPADLHGLADGYANQRIEENAATVFPGKKQPGIGIRRQPPPWVFCFVVLRRAAG